jgi:uncharacterized protein YbjT (DUF2867 family)
MNNKSISVVMLGASGAVGSNALHALLDRKGVQKILLLGRRPIPDLRATDINIEQHKVDIFDTETYKYFVDGYTHAICTLGVGQPSKVSKEEFLKIDKKAVIDFASVCKKSGVQHFEILSSVGVDANSSSFYLKTKGELNETLSALNFDRLSIFQPSMILTPINRYGIMQGIVLKVWPLLKPLLFGPLKKYRGIRVEILGKSMAANLFSNNKGEENLTWKEFHKLVK